MNNAILQLHSSQVLPSGPEGLFSGSLFQVATQAFSQKGMV